MPRCDICGADTSYRELRRCVCAPLPGRDCLICLRCMRSRECGEQVECLLCGGKGYVPRRDEPAITVRCPRCDGRGTVPLVQ